MAGHDGPGTLEHSKRRLCASVHGVKAADDYGLRSFGFFRIHGLRDGYPARTSSRLAMDPVGCR